MRRSSPRLRDLPSGLVLLLLLAASLSAQQLPDTVFRPEVGAPTWAAGAGPVVAVDETHHEMHRIDGSYTAFARLLRADGYRMEAFREPLTAASLAGLDVLVIANALAPENVEEWVLPTPSAFTPAEVETLARWVEGGGALLLVADHMPFPGAVEPLARAFGIEVMNGFAVQDDVRGPMVFRAADGTLAPHALTAGIDSVASFTGQAFRPLSRSGAAGAPVVRPLLVFPPGTVSLNPDTAWVFHEETPTVEVGGWLQGAAVEHGEGRVVILGEAAMLSAQRTGPDAAPMGLNHPVAGQNASFLLALMRWVAAR